MKCHGCNSPGELVEGIIESLDYTTHVLLPGLMVVLHDVRRIGPCSVCSMQWIELHRFASLVTDLEAIHRKFVDRVDCRFSDGEWHIVMRLKHPPKKTNPEEA